MSTSTPTRTRRLTATVLAVLTAIAVVPVSAATAATYVPSTSVTSDTVAPGEAATAGFSAGSFDAGSSVSFSVTGPGLAVLSSFRAATATLSKTATGTGAVTVTVTPPVGAPGNYAVTATGVLNGAATVGIATVTAVAPDATTGNGNDGLAQTGGNDGLAQTGGTDASAQTPTLNGNAVTGPITVTYPATSFLSLEKVNFTVTGSGTATLSAVRAATVTFSKTADVTGSVAVTVTLPANATGSYTLTAVGATSGFAQKDVVIGELASTGFPVSSLLVWAAAGVLLLGLALVLVQTAARRRPTALAAH
ncbi:hypothetical protein E3T55_18975 [Cryobacterium frigoriphilum]|uniref:Sortase n=1 Tax=Cryobacterium frigoriphilum TaxID=1259150 RepID=A0A4V3IQE9_9MICO|nr:hypothetical protein [Cryobacterium frigoriphilum]TFD45353.1 hypothetical protein E3T55_18975 [Cryobacterium frigoriphilum]